MRSLNTRIKIGNSAPSVDTFERYTFRFPFHFYLFRTFLFLRLLRLPRLLRKQLNARAVVGLFSPSSARVFTTFRISTDANKRLHNTIVRRKQNQKFRGPMR